MTARVLIKSILRICQVIGQGEDVDGDSQESEAFIALNSYLASISATKYAVYSIISDTHTLVSGTKEYTIGTGGDINVLRPNRIVSAFIRDTNGSDYPIQIISRERYVGYVTKSTPGRPDELYYDPEYPLGRIVLYRQPDSTDTLHIDSWKPLVQIALVTDELALPQEYERFLKFNMALELAGEYGYAVSDDARRIAKDTKQELKSLNVTPVPEAAFDPILSHKGRRYNINNDQY